MSSRHRDISGLTGRQRDQSPIPKGKNYLFVVAIDEYEHLPKLYNCVKDANDVIQQLVYKYNFQQQHVFQLFDQEASIDNIYKRLLALSRVITDKDNLMIYFSGHGFYDKDNDTGHLIPVHAEKGKVWDYLSNSNFLNWIRAIKSLHTLVILDSCFSGSMFSTKNVTPTYAENVSNYKSRWGLAAGRIEVVDDGLHGENSPFANAIISYLKENTTKKFPVSDLIQYVKKVTSNNSGQTPIAGPIKNLGDEGGEFVFELKTDVATEWNKALTANTAQSYSTFIANYPDSDYAKEAQQKLLPLREAAMWSEIQHMPHKELADVVEKQRMIAEYKFHYPHGKFGIKANELLVHLNKTEDLLTKKRGHQSYDAGQSTTAPQPAQSSDIVPENADKRIEYNKTISKTNAPSEKSSFWTIRTVTAAIMIPVLTFASFFIVNFFNKDKVVDGLKDEIAFIELKDSEAINEYIDFIYEFPQSKYISDVQAMKAELEYFQKMVEKNKKNGYESYLVLFTEGRYRDKAEAAIKALETESSDPKQNAAPVIPPKKSTENSASKDLTPEDIAWNKIKNSNSTKDIQSVRDFINRYDRGKHVRKASVLLGALVMWEKTNKQHTVKDYEDYIFAYSNGPNINQATKALKELRANEDNYWKKAKSKNSESGYNEFLRVYPKSKYAKEAEKSLKKCKSKSGSNEIEAWKKTMGQDNVKSYESFLKKYPKSQYAKEAEERMLQLSNSKFNPMQQSEN